MASFIVKQMLGSKLDAAKGAVPGGGDDVSDEDKEKALEEEAARKEAIEEAENKRKEKHAKMEAEREDMRQGIRDKYNIKKKEKEPEFGMQEPDNPLMRTKKTPEELAAEAEAADQDEFTKMKIVIESQLSDVKSQIEGKCSIQ